ncbi:hypothetical protein C1336_000780013 [Campylobacter jejuni subsp. jejuni 1336]|nr:hypothetical protein C1336_000780013 [Campylobacter jejuni subsp. jejuni 1336]
MPAIISFKCLYLGYTLALCPLAQLFTFFSKKAKEPKNKGFNIDKP